MIILLSPIDNIIDLNKDLTSITDSDLVDVLTQLYEELVIVPEELLKQVTKINFINSVGHTYIINDKVLKDFISRNSKKSKLLFPALKNASVINLRSTKESLDYAGLIMEDRERYIFFDTLLSNDTVMFLSSIKNIVGYRLILKNKKKQWYEIENVEKYLTISAVLYLKFVGESGIIRILKV